MNIQTIIQITVSAASACIVSASVTTDCDCRIIAAASPIAMVLFMISLIFIFDYPPFPSKIRLKYSLKSISYFILLNILSIVKKIKYVTLSTRGMKGRFFLISYKPFFETLLRKNITESELIFKYGISANTIHRMKKGEAITTKTLDVLCYILDCSVSDVIEHDKTK